MKTKNLLIGDISLTPREQQHISFIIRSFTNRDIAFELDIADETVKAEIQTLYNKLRQHGRVNLVKWALDNGWDNNGIYHPKVLTLFD